jgi:hypothetical protein
MRCPVVEVCAFIAGQLATQAEERRAGSRLVAEVRKLGFYSHKLQLTNQNQDFFRLRRINQ